MSHTELGQKLSQFSISLTLMGVLCTIIQTYYWLTFPAHTWTHGWHVTEKLVGYRLSVYVIACSVVDNKKGTDN